MIRTLIWGIIYKLRGDVECSEQGIQCCKVFSLINSQFRLKIRLLDKSCSTKNLHDIILDSYKGPMKSDFRFNRAFYF